MLIFCYNFVVVSKTYIRIDLWRSMRKRLWIVCGISLVVKRDLPTKIDHKVHDMRY